MPRQRNARDLLEKMSVKIYSSQKKPSDYYAGYLGGKRNVEEVKDWSAAPIKSYLG